MNHRRLQMAAVFQSPMRKNMLCFKNLQMLWILVERNNMSSVNKERKLLNVFERKAYGILFIIFRSPFFLEVD